MIAPRPRAAALACLLPLAAACERTPTGNDALRPAAAIPLDVPSLNQTVFAETRDFTVVGYFRPRLRNPGNVQVEVFAGPTAVGTPLRTLRSNVDATTGTTPRASLDFTYRNGQAFGPNGPLTDPARIVMTPDLVKYPGGLRNPANKVVVTRDYYAAVVLGGVTRGFDTDYGDGSSTWSDLTAGTYTIRVSGHSGQLEGLAATRTITFDTTHAMLGRFSPEASKGKLLAYAAERGFRTYIDPFPGFFTFNGYSYEITGRWMANNSVEVVNRAANALVDNAATARNDVLLYNISATSATQRIEIGAIVANGLLNGQTGFHHYDLGEPSLTWVDARTGATTSRAGTIVDLPDSARLVVTRVESRSARASLQHNRFDAGDTTRMLVDIDVSDGVVVRAGDEFSVFGVVAPIPSTVTPGPLAHQYTIANAIDSVRYVIRSNRGTVVQISAHPVGLVRRYDPYRAPDAQATSVYEFEHSFRVASGDSYAIEMTGLDRHGQPVTATTRSFTVVVTAP